MKKIKDMTVSNKYYVMIGFVVLMCWGINGQDLHYSQFYNSPLNLNPAKTGIFNGDQRYIASVRDQWRFVPIPWLTFSGTYDMKIYQDDSDHFFGVGGNFNYDRQGDSKINLSSLNLTGSYTRALNKQNLITAGLLLGFNSRGFNQETLTWDKQWDGVQFDPNLSSQEAFDFERLSFLETGAGINYRWQKSERTKFDLGIGAYHLYEPSTAFYNNDQQKLPRHYTFSGIGNIKLTRTVDIQVQAMHQIQDQYQETLLGGLGKFYINEKRGKETELHLGVGYRTAGSWIPTLAVAFNSWYVSVSYDVDNTEFNQILESPRGGPEVHVRYIIKKVKPITTRKVCPIY